MDEIKNVDVPAEEVVPMEVIPEVPVEEVVEPVEEVVEEPVTEAKKITPSIGALI